MICDAGVGAALGVVLLGAGLLVTAEGSSCDAGVMCVEVIPSVGANIMSLLWSMKLNTSCIGS